VCVVILAVPAVMSVSVVSQPWHGMFVAFKQIGDFFRPLIGLLGTQDPLTISVNFVPFAVC